MTTQEFQHLCELHGRQFVEKRFPYVVRKFYLDHPDLRPADYSRNIEEHYQRDRLFKKKK